MAEQFSSQLYMTEEEKRRRETEDAIRNAIEDGIPVPQQGPLGPPPGKDLHGNPMGLSQVGSPPFVNTPGLSTRGLEASIAQNAPKPPTQQQAILPRPAGLETPKPMSIEEQIAQNISASRKQQMKDRLWSSGEAGLNNAMALILQSGAAIRSGAPQVPFRNPQVTNSLGSASGDAMRMASISQRQQDLALKGESEARRQRQFGRIPRDIREPVINGYNALDNIKLVRDNLANIEDKMGPVSGRWNKALMALGAGNPEVVRSNADLVDLLGMYVKSITGAQVAVAELQRYAAGIPDFHQNPENFVILLDEFEKKIRLKLDNILDVAEGGGYEVQQYRDKLGEKNTGFQGESPAPTEGGSVKMRSPMGAIRDVPAEDVEFMKEKKWTQL